MKERETAGVVIDQCHSPVVFDNGPGAVAATHGSCSTFSLSLCVCVSVCLNKKKALTCRLQQQPRGIDFEST